MSDDLDIRGGGVVVVDTETLRAAADRYSLVAAELIDSERPLRTVAMRLLDLDPIAYDTASTAEALARRVDAASALAGSLAERLRFAAAVYEIVELRAASELAGRSADADEAARAKAQIDMRIRQLGDEYPWAAPIAALRAANRQLTWTFDLAAQGAFGGLALASIIPGAGMALPLGILALGFAITRIGAGTIPAQARLAPASASVRVRPLAPPASIAAPATLAEAAERIPAGSGPARVRVETYTMRDGTRQFAVYVAGTRDSGTGGTEAFDMASNLELYSGAGSASYETAVKALREAGAQPGDVVHAFGHSQGAMITTHLALGGGYDTRTLVSFGSPIEADLGDGTLSVAIRHTDDPVAALEGGGHLQAVGAPGSFVAEREADPAPGLHDLQLPAHGMAGYAETARMLDASVDPRMVPVRDLFAELGTAASADVVEYSAWRLSSLSAGGGG